MRQQLQTWVASIRNTFGTASASPLTEVLGTLATQIRESTLATKENIRATGVMRGEIARDTLQLNCSPETVLGVLRTLTEMTPEAAADFMAGYAGRDSEISFAQRKGPELW